MEDKREICALLAKTLQATRAYDDVVDIIYRKDPDGEEKVFVHFVNGTKTADVIGDSGIGMIRDILKAIE